MMQTIDDTKFLSAQQAVAMIGDGATLAITGAGGGLVEPDGLLAALEQRFLETGLPRGLTVIHAQGLGDGDQRGLNRLAHEGLVARVIGAHWAWSPRMQALAAAEKIEAYALPGGVIQHLLREIGAGRPGLVTHIGLGTMVDPRLGGGRMNQRAQEALSEIIQLDGREYIRYKPFKVDFALLRGSLADARGNTSLEEEGAELDALALAMAAHNSGGKVLVQVRAKVERGALAARSVRLPGALVDAVVAVPDQPQRYGDGFDARLTGTVPPGAHLPDGAGTEAGTEVAASAVQRRIVGARAHQELSGSGIVSFGFGMPDEVAALAARSGNAARYHQSVDHGHYGGTSLQGDLFGFVRDGEAMIDSPSQFDFYSGGGIDIAFLGFGQFDRHGDVNVSCLNGKVIGPGGFIEIAQGSRKIVFCGVFETGGLQVALERGALCISRPGAVRKVVEQVEQVTFSGRQALATGREVLYVTERAVFRLTSEGIALLEIAPGIDLQRDVLDRMGFAPLIPAGCPRIMTAPNCYAGEMAAKSPDGYR
ncbi:MAG: CoA-transferase [Pseudomonadota bacterium]